MAVMMFSNVPDALKVEFKNACISANRSMSKVANELFTRFVKEQESRQEVADLFED